MGPEQRSRESVSPSSPAVDPYDLHAEARAIDNQARRERRRNRRLLRVALVRQSAHSRLMACARYESPGVTKYGRQWCERMLRLAWRALHPEPWRLAADIPAEPRGPALALLDRGGIAALRPHDAAERAMRSALLCLIDGQSVETAAEWLAARLARQLPRGGDPRKFFELLASELPPAPRGDLVAWALREQEAKKGTRRALAAPAPAEPAAPSTSVEGKPAEGPGAGDAGPAAEPMEPVEDSVSSRRRRPKRTDEDWRDLDARAVAELVKNPEATPTKIAEALGLKRVRDLYEKDHKGCPRMSSYTAARGNRLAHGPDNTPGGGLRSGKQEAFSIPCGRCGEPTRQQYELPTGRELCSTCERKGRW